MSKLKQIEQELNLEYVFSDSGEVDFTKTIENFIASGNDVKKSINNINILYVICSNPISNSNIQNFINSVKILEENGLKFSQATEELSAIDILIVNNYKSDHFAQLLSDLKNSNFDLNNIEKGSFVSLIPDEDLNLALNKISAFAIDNFDYFKEDFIFSLIENASKTYLPTLYLLNYKYVQQNKDLGISLIYNQYYKFTINAIGIYKNNLEHAIAQDRVSDYQKQCFQSLNAELNLFIKALVVDSINKTSLLGIEHELLSKEENDNLNKIFNIKDQSARELELFKFADALITNKSSEQIFNILTSENASANEFILNNFDSGSINSTSKEDAHQSMYDYVSDYVSDYGSYALAAAGLVGACYYFYSKYNT
jgi:hypothetical protein